MLIEQNIFEVCCFYTFCITYLVPNVEIAFERIHVKIKLLFLFPPSHVMHGTHVNVLYYFTLKRMLRLLVNITLYSYQVRLWNQCPPHSLISFDVAFFPILTKCMLVELCCWLLIYFCCSHSVSFG